MDAKIPNRKFCYLSCLLIEKIPHLTRHLLILFSPTRTALPLYYIYVNNLKVQAIANDYQSQRVLL
jgi:phosphoheptose isomerase